MDIYTFNRGIDIQEKLNTLKREKKDLGECQRIR